MDIWQAIEYAQQGTAVRHPGMTDGDSIVYIAGGGTTRAVAVKVTAAGVVSVIQITDIATAEFARDDWEVLE